MTETTRALASLPSLDVEIVHDRSEDGSAERIAIRLTGRPNLADAARALEPALLPYGAAAQPWLASQQAFWQRAMAPWLRLNPFLAPLLPTPRKDD